MGHVIRHCPKLKEKKAQRKGGAAKVVNYEDETEKKEDPEPKDGGAAKVVKFRALQAKRSNVPLVRNKMYEWVGDSGATHHMTPFREIIENFDPNIMGTVEVADGEFIEAKGAGRITMLVSDECGGWKLQFNEVIYVPDLDSNLISIIQLDNKGFEIKIKKRTLMVMDKEDTLFKAKNNYGDAYILNCKEYVVNNMNKKKGEVLKEHGEFEKAKARRTVLWHDRLGHMTNLPPVCAKVKCPLECEVCPQGKMNRRKFTLSASRGTDCLDLVHSDVMGKISPPTLGGCKYVVTFLDDFSRYSGICLMKEKSEVFGHFKNFVTAAEAILDKKLKRFQSDNGTEYRNENFKEYTQERGIQHRFSVVRTQQQNGRAERLNKTLFNIVRCIMIKANLPKFFWGEAVMYANEIRNRCPSKAVDREIPYELWFDKKLTREVIEKFRVFGCRVWSLNTDAQSKLDARAAECFFVGHEPGMKGFRLWSLHDHKIIIARDKDVIFWEEQFPYQPKIPTEMPEEYQELVIEDLEEDLSVGAADDELVNTKETEEDPKKQEEEKKLTETGEAEKSFEKAQTPDTSQQADENNLEKPAPVRRSSRKQTQKNECKLGCCKKVQCTLEIKAPENVGEVLSRPDKEEWLMSMHTEMENHWCNQTWTIVKRPKYGNVVGSKWVYCIKNNGPNTIYKSRLVAQGFSQKLGIDYWDDTYSPVISKTSLRLITSLSVQRGWIIDHIDVVAAYLNGILEETVYMEQAKLFEEGDKHLVYQLNKSIYGLHQSGKAWNEVLVKHLKEMGLTQGVSDPCIFVHEDGIVGVCVDDLVLCGKP